MKNLYIDFDGVIMNTIEISYKELVEKGLDHKNIADQEAIRDYYTNLDWDNLLNNKALIINDAISCIKNILYSKIYEVTILSHVNSLEWQIVG